MAGASGNCHRSGSLRGDRFSRLYFSGFAAPRGPASPLSFPASPSAPRTWSRNKSLTPRCWDSCSVFSRSTAAACFPEFCFTRFTIRSRCSAGPPLHARGTDCRLVLQIDNERERAHARVSMAHAGNRRVNRRSAHRARGQETLKARRGRIGGDQDISPGRCHRADRPVGWDEAALRPTAHHRNVAATRKVGRHRFASLSHPTKNPPPSLPRMRTDLHDRRHSSRANHRASGSGGQGPRILLRPVTTPRSRETRGASKHVADSGWPRARATFMSAPRRE